MAKVDANFIDDVKRLGEFNASACMHCGTCTALCPMEVDLLPRRLFRYVVMGLKDKMIENIPAIYSCLLCKMCEDNCPGEVRIVENVRILRDYVNRNIFKLAGD